MLILQVNRKIIQTLIVADRKIPENAKNRLKADGELVLFETKGITYEAISGHPDIFMCRVADQWVVAPNLPDQYLVLFSGLNIRFRTGEHPVGERYPETALYNVVCTDNHLMHNFRYTDSVITSLASDLDLVHLNQGYARCSLIALNNNRYITSDEGISRTLQQYGFEVLFVDPAGIQLPGFRNGFIGGTAGIRGEDIYFIGSLGQFHAGEKIRSFLEQDGYKIVELYDGPLFDGGGILFVGD